jgi:signal transduction histidine kinase
MGIGDTSEAADYGAYRSQVLRERLPRAGRNGAVIVAALTTAFIGLDWLVFRERFFQMLWVRVFCDLVMILIAGVTAERLPRTSCIVGVLCAGCMLLAVIWVAGGAGGAYTPGLMLLFLGMPVLLPLTAWEAAGIVGFLVLGLGMLLVVGPEHSAHGQLLQLAFPLAAGAESVVACGLLDRLRFSDFLQRREIERARDELKDLDAAKSRFTANIHHELRTPLTLTLAPVEAMLGGQFGELNAVQRSYLETVQSNGLRLLKLINNLLDLAKIESQQLAITRRPLRVHEVIEEIASNARPLAERKGVSLEVGGLDELPAICADREALEKVLVNLLGNALKFTDRGGAIRVLGAREGKDGVHLVVADTGAGIPASQLERIFDRFAQVDSSNTRKYEGTGIGLALVKELVELHGGRVWAASEGPGRGAQMHVVLPAGESDAGEEEQRDAIAEAIDDESGELRPALANAIKGMGAELQQEEPDPASPGLQMIELQRNVERHDEATRVGSRPAVPEHGPETPEVLVVEDNIDMRRLLHHLVGQEFRVRLARDGREGLAAAREQAPDLILTDVMMPEMSGTELCAAIKSDPALAAVPVVLVTSKAEREMKIQGLEFGADDYVTKPFHPRELMARVRSLVKLRQAQQLLAERNALLETTNDELVATMDELKEAGAQLVHAERLAAVGELAAGVAHEINNPVNFAMNAARTLRAVVDDVRVVAEQVRAIDPGDTDALRRQIDALETLRERLGFDESAETLAELTSIVTEGLERTAGLVGDLRDFAAPGSRELGPVDVARGLRTTLRLMGHTMVSAGVEIHTDIPEGLPEIRGDARALNQVFLNLLKNAAESFEHGAGAVHVAARVEGEDAVLVEIRDDGPGIAPEVRDRLFEPFVTTKMGRGSGLGLSICKRIVEEHGGELQLESALGAGTRVTLRFPLSGPSGEGRDAA